MKPIRSTFIALTFAMMSLALASCGKSKQVFTAESHTERNERTEVIEHDRDTTFNIPAETSTALIQATVQDDGSVQLNIIAQTSSESLDAPVLKPIGNNMFQVDCEKRAQELFAEWKERHETKTIEVLKTETIAVPVERELTFWQETLIFLGWLVVIALVVIVGIVAYKIFKMRR